MVKKGEFITILSIVVILAGLNLFLFFNKGSASYSAFSGMVAVEFTEMPESFKNFNISTIAFIAQWVLLLIIVLVAYARHLSHKKEEDVKISYNSIKQQKTKSGTDLDVFYNILKQKKKLRINVIAKIFKISKEKALDWAKILENQDLAMIEYPAFNDPEVRIKEVKINEKEESKEKQVDEEKREREKKRHREKTHIPKVKPKKKRRK